MKRSILWIGACAAIGLSGCAASLVSSWRAPDAQPFGLQGEKVAAVVMVSDQSIRLTGEDALARELSSRGVHGVPMYTLLADAVPDESKARAAAEQAGVVGVVVLRPVRIDKEVSSRPMNYPGPMYGGFWGGYFGHGWGAPWSVQGGEIRTDTIVIVETLVYSLAENQLVWSGQSKTRNPKTIDGLIASTAKQVGGELARQGLIHSKSNR
ncbi:MAG: hypothetical protein M3O07_11135 [Pseudomonadota bacterium]|nr:hypothetical protein [Pseudomonadota bacterium]